MRTRSIFVLLHRWFGLTMAGFLFVAGLTGAVISWDHELDEWLNPDLARPSDYASQPQGDRAVRAKQR